MVTSDARVICRVFGYIDSVRHASYVRNDVGHSWEVEERRRPVEIGVRSDKMRAPLSVLCAAAVFHTIFVTTSRGEDYEVSTASPQRLDYSSLPKFYLQNLVGEVTVVWSYGFDSFSFFYRFQILFSIAESRSLQFHTKSSIQYESFNFIWKIFQKSWNVFSLL